MIRIQAKEESLFGTEEETIQEAKALVASGMLEDSPVAAHFEALLDRYRKLFRQCKSLIRISDSIQNDLSRLNDQLKESEEKYRAIFENVTDGIYRAEPDGTFIEVNPAMARILGYESPEDLVLTLNPSGTEPFADPEEKRLFEQSILETGGTEHHQVRMICKNGSPIWVTISARLVSNANNGAQHVEGLVADITERKRMEEELRELATTDGLTRLCNRRHFMELGCDEVNRAKRYGHPISLMMLDLDRFKNINDTHGHVVGDRVLQKTADTGRETLRKNDVFGRLGGEEFAVLLPETDLTSAGHVAERFRQNLDSASVPTPQGPVRFTASIGVSAGSKGTLSLENLLRNADEALYAAKQKGRNRVEIGW